jgi:hypothetical protein
MLGRAISLKTSYRRRTTQQLKMTKLCEPAYRLSFLALRQLVDYKNQKASEMQQQRSNHAVTGWSQCLFA